MPGSTGQLKEVTEAMVQSVKSRKVDYDERELAEDPSIIILNSRKFTPEPSRIEREAGREPLARPL
jgi:hypothetical protein